MGFGSNIKRGESLEERYAYIKDSQCSRMKTPGIYNPSVRLKISHNKSKKNEFTQDEQRFQLKTKNIAPGPGAYIGKDEIKRQATIQA